MTTSLSKNFFSLFIFCLLLFSQNAKSQVIFTLTPASTSICAGTSVAPASNVISCVLAGTVSGASYYTCIFSSGISLTNISWSGPASTLGSTANITALCSAPGVYTMTSLAYASTSSSVILASTTQTLLALAGPSITVSGPSTVCPNSVNTYTAAGASTYTWFASIGSGTYSINGGAVASMTAGALATFSVRGSSANGCVNSNVFSPSIGSTSVSVSNNTICAGSSATLSASGALTYTWNSGSNFAVIVVSPSVSTVYTLNSSNMGCTITSTHAIAVTSTPNLTVSPSQNLCAGTSGSIVASGANSYTWLPGFLNNSVLLINPSVSTCYTVIGSNGGNCTSSAVSCVSVMPSPTVTVVSSGSVCSGSSVSFTASGANSYIWNTGSMGSTITTIPSSGGNIMVMGSHTLNGCTHTATIAMIVSPSCAIVWPGDANRDGLVTTADVLELGLAAGSTGAARSSTSNAWSGQYATAWGGTLSTGWNKVHADCNGDGIVNANDNAAITANFGLSHAFKPLHVSANADIALVPQQAFAYEGVWNKVDVVLGSVSNTLTQLYGLAFEINYNQNNISNDSVKLIYSSSFLNANNQTIDFSKSIFTNGKLYCASVRVDHQNISGQGKIAEFWYKVKNGLASGSTINLLAGNAQKINAGGVLTNLTSESGLSININSNVTGLRNQSIEKELTVFPNPANEVIHLNSTLKSNCHYNLIDLTGRILMSGDFKESSSLNTSHLNKGVYLLELNTLQGQTTKKLIIE